MERDSFADISAALDRVLTERFPWYGARTSTERNAFIEVATAMVHSTRTQIRIAGKSSKRARRDLPVELPCFACGRPATTTMGEFFDYETVLAAWAKHHGIEDDEEALDAIQEHLASRRLPVNGTGAHAMCALIEAVRGARLDDYPAHVVPLR
jgi:hypothetical protein